MTASHEVKFFSKKGPSNTGRKRDGLNQGIDYLKTEEDRLLNMMRTQQPPVTSIGKKYKPKQLAITQTLSEQRKNEQINKSSKMTPTAK